MPEFSVGRTQKITTSNRFSVLGRPDLPDSGHDPGPPSSSSLAPSVPGAPAAPASVTVAAAVPSEAAPTSRKPKKQTKNLKSASAATSEVNQVTTTSSALIKLSGFVGSYPAVVLIDCGATGCFVSQAFVEAKKLDVSASDAAHTVTLADGRQQAAGSVVRSAAVRVGSYADRLDLTVTGLQGYDVILGMPWLEQYRVVCDWRGKSVSFVGPKGVQHVLQRAPTGCQRWCPATVVGAMAVAQRRSRLSRSSGCTAKGSSSSPAWYILHRSVASRRMSSHTRPFPFRRMRPPYRRRCRPFVLVWLPRRR